MRGDFEMNSFLVVFEPTHTGYSAYVPDLPGCVATGGTVTQVETNLAGAIRLHLEGMAEDNMPIPQALSFAEKMVIA